MFTAEDIEAAKDAGFQDAIRTVKVLATEAAVNSRAATGAEPEWSYLWEMLWGITRRR